MSKPKKEKPASPLPLDKLERNTFTLSVLVVLIGLFCLPHVEQGGDTFYVLLLVFLLNALLLFWVVSRIVRRALDEKKEQKK